MPLCQRGAACPLPCPLRQGASQGQAASPLVPSTPGPLLSHLVVLLHPAKGLPHSDLRIYSLPAPKAPAKVRRHLPCCLQRQRSPEDGEALPAAKAPVRGPLCHAEVDVHLLVLPTPPKIRLHRPCCPSPQPLLRGHAAHPPPALRPTCRRGASRGPAASSLLPPMPQAGPPCGWSTPYLAPTLKSSLPLPTQPLLVHATYLTAYPLQATCRPSTYLPEDGATCRLLPPYLYVPEEEKSAASCLPTSTCQRIRDCPACACYRGPTCRGPCRG